MNELLNKMTDVKEYNMFRFMNSIFGHYTMTMGHGIEVQNKILN